MDIVEVLDGRKKIIAGRLVLRITVDDAVEARDEITRLREENEKLDKHNETLLELLHEKINCACCYDNKDDTCMDHFPHFKKLKAENEKLRSERDDARREAESQDAENGELREESEKLREALNVIDGQLESGFKVCTVCGHEDSTASFDVRLDISTALEKDK